MAASGCPSLHPALNTEESTLEFQRENFNILSAAAKLTVALFKALPLLGIVVFEIIYVANIGFYSSKH